MNRFAQTVVVACLALVLFGCGASAPATTAAPTADQKSLEATITARIILTQAASAPASTATLNATDTPVATSTGTTTPTVQASDTPRPALSQTPNASPAAFRFTAGVVGAAFKAAGLEFEQVSPLTKTDYGIAPYLCTTALHFIVPSVCVDCGGRVFECPNQDDRDRLAKYYTEAGKISAAFYSWVYVRENIVVQINGELPEAKARQYEAVLNGLK
jgi:hypothetical protein